MRQNWMIAALLVLIAGGLMIRFDRPLIRGDGIAYLAWVDSLVRDGDIDLENQAQRLAPVNSYHVVQHPETEKFITVFPFGVAIVQAPFYALADQFHARGWWNANPDYFRQMQGVEQAYSLWLMIGANLMMIGALLLTWRLTCAVCDRWTAALIALALFVGTPLFFYSTVNPLNSHNPGAFVLAIFMILLARVSTTFPGSPHPSTPPHDSTSQDMNPSPESPPHAWGGGRRWGLYFLLLGITAGLIVLIRWQLLLVVGLGGLLVIYERQWRGAAIFAVSAFITLLPLPLSWNALFGSPFIVPNESLTGESFLILPPPYVLNVLADMLLRSPVMIFPLLGIPFLWKISRPWAVFALSAIGLQLLINGAVIDWYAGDGFGMRRMSELYPLYGLLAGCLLGYVTRDRWRVIKIALRVAMALLIPYAILYLIAFLTYTWTNPQGRVTDTPYQIFYYFDHLPNRGLIVETIFRTHLGPPAWDEPGP